MKKLLIIATLSLISVGCATVPQSQNVAVKKNANNGEQINYNLPLREFLVTLAKKHKGFHILTPPDMSVFAIDDKTTVVYLDTGTAKGGVGRPWFAKALREYCKAHGKQLLYEVKRLDPISGKMETRYYPIRIMKILGIRSDEGFNDIAYHDGIKCDDLFEASTKIRNPRNVAGNVFETATLVANFKTSTKQPLVYFVPGVPSLSKIKYPKVNDFGIAELKTSDQTFETLYVLCKKDNGKFLAFSAKYKKDKCLRPISNLEAFEQFVIPDRMVALVCDNGNKSFVAIRRPYDPTTYFKFTTLGKAKLNICSISNNSSKGTK